MKTLIECVPNYSEGRDLEKIEQITDAIRSVSEIKLLNVDPGKDTNRTVVTFVGEPEFVIEAAFRGIKKAAEVIDMSKHKGEHPRFGATDVCPLIPIANVSMEESVEYSRKLGERVGRELGIPVFCYEYSASAEERKSLANCRSGEYEGLKEKMGKPQWKPDFGPGDWSEHIARTGATAIGARNFLIAYNINLNTNSVQIAKEIAAEIRESGRLLHKGDHFSGEIVRDEFGNPLRVPGRLKNTRALGWYIKEYGIAQVSTNLTDINVTPVHVAFEEIYRSAEAKGIKVTGSELVGLIPLNAMLEAGKFYLKKKHKSINVTDDKLIEIAIKGLGLDNLKPFQPKEKIIEYLIKF